MTSNTSKGKRAVDIVLLDDSDDEQAAPPPTAAPEAESSTSSALPSRAEMERERLARVEALRRDGKLSATGSASNSASRPPPSKKPRVMTLADSAQTTGTSTKGGPLGLGRTEAGERFFQGAIKPTYNTLRPLDGSISIEQVLGPVCVDSYLSLCQSIIYC
jgi:tyrosyl-DNA phosphodiesterase-1